MTKATDTKRLKDVLLAYGARPENWPEDEREALAETASSDDAEVQALLREAQEIDTVLNRLPEARVPEGAVERALAAVMEPPAAPVIDLQTARARRSPLRLQFDPRQAIPVGIAMAASLMIGVLVGFSELASNYIPDSGTITLASVAEDNVADTLMGFETFTLAEGELQ